MSEVDEKDEFARKQKRAKKVAKLITGARDLLGLDRFFDTRFARDFSGVMALPQTESYLLPQEFKDPDEADLFDKLKKSFEADTTEELEEGAALTADKRLNPGFIDPHWGHTTGHLYGTLEIDEPDKLHPDLRVGLFGKKGTYEVYCRPNYLYDPNLPIAINRMSLKLRMPELVPNVYATSGEAKELDLLLSEGLPPGNVEQPDGQGFFFRDARQLLMANEMKNGLLSVAEVLLDGQDAEICRHWKEEIFTTSTDMLYSRMQTQLTWDQKWYFSAGPYALGKGVMKFALEPAAQEHGDHISIFQNPAAVHAEAFSDIATKATEIRFILKVQVANEASIPDPKDDEPPKCVKAAEFTDLAWDTRAAPFETVGTLTLRPHQVDVTDPSMGWYKMGFNAWNTFHSMRPLGQLFRARKVVHAHHRDKRLRHSFAVANPNATLGACPFRP